MRIGFAIVLLGVVAALGSSCQREDGLPDPPVQTLVPCDPSAAPSSASACPPDAAIPLDAGDD